MMNYKYEQVRIVYAFYKEFEQCMAQLLKLFINWYNGRVNLKGNVYKCKREIISMLLIFKNVKVL